ncbi:hypothetical protein [Saccharibacillus qingshengii]|uniref:hypothetical protein n=1 Tax=Saccharibacillus qingshengii TaxID=1763540 RepID=UPI001554FC94|nr:hypothetical protein [Saccharibacillus qingshengii]
MNQIGILGVVHNEELRIQHGLTLETIKALILEFDPDVICGEVLPASWDKYRQNSLDRGYWGEPASEYYESIFPLCEEKGYAFEPIDWVELDVWNDFDPMRHYSEEARIKLEAKSGEWWEKQLAAAGKGTVAFNCEAFDETTRLKYQWLERLDAEAHAFRWTGRHIIMMQRIKNAIKRHPGKKMLCIVGADHNHVLNEELRKMEQLEVWYPLK